MVSRRFLCILLFSCVFATAALAGLSKAKKEFSKAFKAKDFSRAGKALKEAAADDGKKSAEWIIKTVTKRKNHIIYRAGVEALKSMKSNDAIGYICKQARGRSIESKILCVNAMAEMSDETTAKVLQLMLGDKDETVVREVVLAIGERKLRDGVGKLIETLKKYEKSRGRTYACILRALTRIAYLGDELTTAAQWKDFWEREKPRNIDDPLQEGGVWRRRKLRALRGLPNLFGTSVESKRVLFIIDSSGAMELCVDNSSVARKADEGITKDARWFHARDELLKTIRQLDKSAKFDVMLCPKSPSSCFGKLKPATKKNVEKVVKFLEEAETETSGRPNLKKALEKARACKDVTSMFIILGGAPLDEATGPGGTCDEAMGGVVDAFLGENVFWKIQVNVFSYTRPDSQEDSARKLWADFLEYSKKFAESSDGFFKGLPKSRNR
ncbi:MAG: hypothetical protein E3J72_18560 [Planctomycetota bacterium]|nr:MAG: hypothetical protein E3J72_18560 [Planctomycetota bacterium]